METIDWPISNYPIFFALVLLAATAITLSMGNEPHAEEFAIYAYYLLVIGVTIRFFELALPDRFHQKFNVIPHKIAYHIGKCKYLPELSPSVTQKIELNKFSKYFVYFSDMSKNLTVYLFIIYLLVTAYGLIYGWWIVKGFLEKMGLIILIFFTFYLISTTLLKKYPPNTIYIIMVYAYIEKILIVSK